MKANDICEVFEHCFLDSHRTCLQGNANEPFYLPAHDDLKLNTIYFRDDYPASALHEVSHWCIAGKVRRAKEDFGYWYENQRDSELQREFELYEARPQALEWIFSVAAGLSFRVSYDNFRQETLNFDVFRRQVRTAANEWLIVGLPDRAEIFVEALLARSGVPDAYQHTFYEELPN